jgi:acyl-CoA thioesterase-1
MLNQEVAAIRPEALAFSLSMLRWAISSCVTLVLLVASAAAAPRALGCSAPQELTRFRVKLPNTARTVRSRKPVVIVAIGSSSTAGVGASDPAHTYPARLAEELHQRWPWLAVNVINKGIAGELASQMLARFERDVLPYHPQLVIWQTGSNRLLRSENIEGYTETIREGINRLKAAETDVVLLDPQFAPRVLARRIHLQVVDAIAAVANDTNVAVFPRFAVMSHWISSGQYKIEDIISSDGLHMNDVSYGCLARLLAATLVEAVESGTENRRRIEGAKDGSR